MINKIHHGDCLEIMKDIPDGSVDMILCDLPYGTTRNKWDSVISLDDLWKQYNRIIKDSGAIALFGSEPFTSQLRMSNFKNYKYDWYWEKPNSTGFLNAKKQPLRAIETVSMFYRKQPKYNPQMTAGDPYKWSSKRGQSESYNKHNEVNREIVNNGERYPRNILKFKQERGLHPTQKPVGLMEYLIKTYTNEGETVLDNCIGSGTTAIAALNLNRNFIGIEQEKEYVDIANKRIEEHKLQLV